MGRELDPRAGRARRPRCRPEAGPFNPRAPLGYVPIAGRDRLHARSRVDHARQELGRRPAKTYVEFDGRTAYYQRSRIPFHVTSLDWQEADRVFAGILTAFGSPTSAVPVGGFGEFDGVMLGAFNDPRIEGTFTGDHMRAWDVRLGTRHRRRRHRRQLRQRQPQLADQRRLRDQRDRTLLARLPAPRRRRGDQRAGRAATAGRWPTCATPSSWTTGRSTGSSRASTTLTGQLRNAVRRRHAARRQTASPTARPFERATAQLKLRRDRRPAREVRRPEEHRHDHRRRVGRLGRQLLVHRRWRPHPGRVAEDRRVSRRRRSPGSCGSRRRAPAPSRCRTTT